MIVINFFLGTDCFRLGVQRDLKARFPRWWEQIMGEEEHLRMMLRMSGLIKTDRNDFFTP
jgi:hypothetical protein